MRVEQIRERLQSLHPVCVEIEDDSHLHEGHPGARDGRGHFRVRIVADCFADESKLSRHRMVYQALGSLMQSEIHALSISTLTPAEAGPDEDN